jgi:hypothetical protein
MRFTQLLTEAMSHVIIVWQRNLQDLRNGLVFIIQNEFTMSQPLSYFIEEIKDSHPEMELEHLILSAVAVMTAYSPHSYCDFQLECQDLPADWVRGNVPSTIRIHWHSETAIRAKRISKIHQRKNLVEFAAIAIAFILFPQVVDLSGFEPTDIGERADYWIANRKYLVEISGTETLDKVRQRRWEKIAQLLSNPSKQDGYVVVCGFATQEILLSFHQQEEKNG